MKCGFSNFGGPAARAFTPHSFRCLNCPSNLIGQDHPDKPAGGVEINGMSLQPDTVALGHSAVKKQEGG
jgi:hypothetical protein